MKRRTGGEIFPNLAIYLEEIKYYLADVLNDDWQRLLKLAAGNAGSNAEPLILAPEKSEKVLEPDIEDAIRSMQSNHILFSRKSKSPLMLIVEKPTEMQRKLMYQVERLQFLCKGRATVFPYPQLTQQLRWRLQHEGHTRLGARELRNLVSPYYDFVLETEPQWFHQIRQVENGLEMVSPFYNDYTVTQKVPYAMRSIEEAGGMFRLARCAAVVMLFSDERGDFVWLVWEAKIAPTPRSRARSTPRTWCETHGIRGAKDLCGKRGIGEKNDGGQWGFPAGHVIRKVDGDLLGTAQREWNEEVLGFEFEASRDFRVQPVVLPFLASDSRQYPVQTYVYAKATSQFFESTLAGRDRFQFELPPNSIRSSSQPSNQDYRRLNTDPTSVFVEHEWGAWAQIKADGWEVPEGQGPLGSTVDWENSQALKTHWPHIKEYVLSQPLVLQTTESKKRRVETEDLQIDALNEELVPAIAEEDISKLDQICSSVSPMVLDCWRLVDGQAAPLLQQGATWAGGTMPVLSDRDDWSRGLFGGYQTYHHTVSDIFLPLSAAIKITLKLREELSRVPSFEKPGLLDNKLIFATSFNLIKFLYVDLSTGEVFIFTRKPWAPFEAAVPSDAKKCDGFARWFEEYVRRLESKWYVMDFISPQVGPDLSEAFQ
ncbi:unnamed protein product [Symbiodinium sp. CCMP2592]|nr:unnamed protein product [Symbiodinium sp. CCMP2592]